MKHILFSALMLLTTVFSAVEASETIYENAEDRDTNPWYIYDNTPAGASIENVYDNDKNSYVIELNGEGTANGFGLGHLPTHNHAWHNTTEKILELDTKFSGYYSFFVMVQTDQGRRFLYYSAMDNNRGKINSEYIHFGLGSARTDGVWHTERLELERDLQLYEPDNHITEVDGILIRGNGRVDNILLTNEPPKLPDVTYEDAEDGSNQRWSVYDNNPAGASVNVIYDDIHQSQVIQLQGDATHNGYMIGNWAGRSGAWNERERKYLHWDMRFSEWFMFMVNVQTTDGQRYMYYTPSNHDRGVVNGQYIHHGLSAVSMNGEWHTFSRNLQEDLQDFEPGNKIVSVDGILIRGSGEVDNIVMSQHEALLPPTVYADFEDHNFDNWTIINNPSGYARMIIKTPSFNGSTACGRFIATGGSLQNLYRLPVFNKNQTILEVEVGGFDGINMPHYLLGVIVETDLGERFMFWDSYRNHVHATDTKTVYGESVYLKYQSPIELVRGYSYAPQDQVELFRVDIQAYLEELEPGNKIKEVRYFVTGGGWLDNIRLVSE